jgi:peptide/nickel transport system substrate-binding protein/oligopeptide transport system substrate-binding protein
VVEKKLIDAYPGGLWAQHLDTGGCSGPFMVHSYGKGTQLTLVPNPYWELAWNQHLTLSAIVRPVLGSRDTMYTNYDRQGLYDYTDVPSDVFGYASSQGDFHEIATLATNYFGLSGHEPPFDNLYVRQAFDLALNKQYIVDTVEGGGAIPTNHIIPQGMPGYFPGLRTPGPDPSQSITGNQAGATALLQKAQAECAGQTGAPGTPFDYCPYITGLKPKPIVIDYLQGQQTAERIVNDAVQNWSGALTYSVGGTTVSLDVQGLALSPQTLVGYLLAPRTNTMQAWTIGWLADYPDPQDWTTLQFKTGVPGNTGLWSIPGFDALVDKADVDLNYQDRMSLYNKAEQVAVDWCGWIPYEQAKFAWRLRTTNTREVLGFTRDALGFVPHLTWPQVEIWVPGSQ